MEELLAKYFSGEATLDERSLVDSWKSESKENAIAFFESKIVWADSERVDENYDYVLASILDEKPVEKNAKHFFLTSPWVKYAAAAMLIFAIGLLVILNKSQTNFETQSLADGSEIALHSDARIEVMAMNESVREVKLTGKAYFDIERDENRPFIIHTNNSTIRVLGTSFVIDSDDYNTQVAVETGLVELIKSESELSVKLGRGEIGLVTNENKGIIKKENDNPNYLAWKTRMLVFDNSEIAEVTKVLEDVYGIKVILDNPTFNSCKLTAKINKKKAKEAIEIIARTFSLEYKFDGKSVTFAGKGC